MKDTGKEKELIHFGVNWSQVKIFVTYKKKNETCKLLEYPEFDCNETYIYFWVDD